MISKIFGAARAGSACQNVSMTTPVPALALALAFEGDAVPEWVMLFPAGGRIEGRDGRTFLMEPSDADLMIASFAADGGHLPVDLEHASQVRAVQGLDAPAVGWITGMEARGGAVWARVEWTAKGRELVGSRAYRYISPSFHFDKPTGRVLRAVSAGLTNMPNFRMTAVARERADEEETSMDKGLLEALGLKEGASAEEALAAARELKGKVDSAESELATARESAKGKAVDPQLYVPRADFEAATARVETLENAEKARAAAAEEAAVDEAIKAGKITPAGREYHLATCRVIGAAAFRTHMDAQPAIATASRQVGVGEDPAKGKVTLTDDEVAMARQFGRSPEAFAKLKAEEMAR